VTSDYALITVNEETGELEIIVPDRRALFRILLDKQPIEIDTTPHIFSSVSLKAIIEPGKKTPANKKVGTDQ
jgi:hypothetical protein